VSQNIPFEVVGRSKTERINKGKREIIFKITLKSTDSLHRLVLASPDSAIIEKYPLDEVFVVKIGKNPQSTLPKTET